MLTTRFNVQDQLTVGHRLTKIIQSIPGNRVVPGLTRRAA